MGRAASIRWSTIATWLWGAALATALTWPYFTYPPGVMHANHDTTGYVLRLVEFVECLREGQLFPQWTGDFRGGLGSPYFGYYQPGFFYLASAFTPFLSPTAALGAALWVVSLLGFSAVAALVRERFGPAAGLLGGTALLLSHYPRVEIYLRGDLSEYAGLMIMPVALYAMVAWFEDVRPRTWCLLALTAGTLIVMHPAAGLVGYGVLAATIAWYAIALREWRRAAAAVGAMLLGVALTAFYCLPVALEWSLVRGNVMAVGAFHYSWHFIPALTLLGHGSVDLVRPSLQWVVPTLAVVGSIALVAPSGDSRAAQRRLVALLWVTTAVAAFLMTSASTPVWRALPLLQKIQFPWRLLMVVAVTTSILAGCQSVRPGVVAAVGIVALLWVAGTEKFGRLESHPAVRTSSDLRELNFAPDAVDEWLPRGAVSFRDRVVPREPACIPECESISVADRGPAWFRVRITTGGGASVVLPHYYFPVGWEVTVNGGPVRVTKNADGLMKIFVVLPMRDGVITARFHGTPMRKRGIAVSACAFAIWCGVLVAGRRRGSREALTIGPASG